MSTLKGIPLEGQGEPLPLHFPYKGQWILEPRMFLYRPTYARAVPGTEMMPIFMGEDGKPVFGVSVTLLSALLLVSEDEVFAHNAARTLYLVTTVDIPDAAGGPVKRYVFQIGPKQVPIDLRYEAPSGHA